MKNEFLSFILVYSAGVLSFFSPCIFPIIPIYISILSNGEKKSIIKTIMFLVGLSTTFFILGFGAGSIGLYLLSPKVRVISGIIIILLGLFQLDIFKSNVLNKTKMLDINSEKYGVFSPFIIGLTFSFSWTPCVGPVLSTLLVTASSFANIPKSILLLTIYSLGMATPFLIFSFMSKEMLKKSKFLNKYLNLSKKIGGVIIIIMGLLLVFNKINIFLTI